VSQTLTDVTAAEHGAPGQQPRDRDLTVVLAQSDEMTLSTVRYALERDGFDVVAEAHDAAEAVAAALEHRPDVCLLELDLPGDGLLASRQIYSRAQETRIAVLASSVGEEEAFRAIRAGADGYLLSAGGHDRLGAALRAVARGESALPRSLTARFVRELRQAPVIETAAPRTHGWLNRTVMYVPRFVRHYLRRRRSEMGRRMAWRSARERMRGYRAARG
jgi:DNA-binding NarL/FixJ family response regulator